METHKIKTLITIEIELPVDAASKQAAAASLNLMGTEEILCLIQDTIPSLDEDSDDWKFELEIL